MSAVNEHIHPRLRQTTVAELCALYHFSAPRHMIKPRPVSATARGACSRLFLSFNAETQRRRGAECSTPTVGKRPPLPLRLALRTPQPLTRDFRCRFVDRIYKIDRIEKRELERCTPLATAYATRPAASWATQTHSRRRFAAARGRGES